jgi:type IV secretion system protein TrbL
MFAVLDAASVAQPTNGCAWWNLVCKGGQQAANSGLSAITKSIASGAEVLLSQIVKVVDQSSTVPLADPTYRHVYYGFLGLAAPLIGVVLSIALIVAAMRRDSATLGRAVVGVGIAAFGGALYIVFAQLLVAIDDWLSHGVVEVTGYNLSEAINEIAVGFHHIAGAPGEVAANMLLLLLMLVMLISGLILWFVLVLRKIAILVVVAFAPLLIAGYLWGPTRSWVRKTTEVLIALVFTKTAIFALFGVGLALLSRGGGQTLSDFVGTTVLMCGACFAPLLMLRLVHFAADSQLAGDAMGTLRGGMRPVTSHLHGRGSGSGSPMGRHDLARQQSSSPRPDSPEPVKSGPLTGTPSGAPSGTTATSAPQGAGTGTAGLVAGGVATGLAAAGAAATQTARAGGDAGARAATALSQPPDPADQPRRGPSLPGSEGNPGEDPR